MDAKTAERMRSLFPPYVKPLTDKPMYSSSEAIEEALKISLHGIEDGKFRSLAEQYRDVQPSDSLLKISEQDIWRANAYVFLFSRSANTLAKTLKEANDLGPWAELCGAKPGEDGFGFLFDMDIPKPQPQTTHYEFHRLAGLPRSRAFPSLLWWLAVAYNPPDFNINDSGYAGKLMPILDYSFAVEPSGRVRIANTMMRSIQEAAIAVITATEQPQKNEGLPQSSNQRPKGNRYNIDSTPKFERPPQVLIAAAERDIPDVMANLPHVEDGQTEIEAAKLVSRLRDLKHSMIAATWAVHESVNAGRLAVDGIRVDLPIGYSAIRDPMRSVGIPDIRESAGRSPAIIAIPQGVPTPFDRFNVRSTPALWVWWRSLNEDDAKIPEQSTDDSETQPADDHSAETKKKKKQRRGRRKADDETVEKESEIFDDWERARQNNVYKGTFAKDKNLTLRELGQLLDRVRKRRNRSEN